MRPPDSSTLSLCRWINCWNVDLRTSVEAYGIKPVKQAIRIHWLIFDDLDRLHTTAEYFIEYAGRLR